MVKPILQRARNANPLHPHHIRRKTVAVAVAACFTTGVAMANPTAPTVVHGTATMSQAGGILNITNSHNAIINWGSFSIGVNELTRFIQPSALSAVLNRVVGQDPSAILGALQSNGRVFLLNPNGIVFGSGAQINVAGLVASTLNLSNDDFLNNRMRFTDGAGAGSVVNQGNITGGNVYLIGNAVANNGLITSPNGEVVLAAGNSVELVNPGTPNLRVEVVASTNEARNLGTISAEAGRIGIYAGLIKQGGIISADSAVAEGGRIMLKSTKSTALEAGSVTSARGTSGGEIIALSGMTDGKTEVAGKLDASAIASGTPGAGGFIETSAAKVKIADSAMITAAGSGGSKAGTWLIDPADFYISNAYGGDMSATFLSSALDAYGGTNVDIQSTSGYGGSTGTIFVNDTVSWSADSTLRLIAIGNVDVNSAITNTGNGAVKLYAGWTGAFDGSSNPIVGFTAAPSQNINLNAPISTLGDIHLIANGNIVQGAPGSLTANGLLASSSNGSVDLANPSATNNVNTVAGHAVGQFAFKNSGDLTVGTVGGVSGITAYGGFSGLHVTVDVGVTGGALTVSNPIGAYGADGSEGDAGGNANISLTASNGINGNSNLTALAGHGGSAFYGGAPGEGGIASINLTSTGVGSSVNINSSAGSVNAVGGGGGDGFSSGIDGARGGDGTINVTSAGGILVEASVQANGGHGGSGSFANGGRAGDGIVNMSANGGDLTIGAYGGVAAFGGNGGYANYFGDGGRGGDASVNLFASGGLTVTGTARAFGGLGGSGSSGAGGRGGDALVNLTAGGTLTIDSMQNFAVKADGGEGGVGDWDGNGGRGGDGTVNLTSGGAMVIGNSGVSFHDVVYARGGNGGYVDGGEGFTGGDGGLAKVEVTSAGGIAVYANVAAQGGYGNAGFSGSGSSTSFLGRGGDGIVMMTNNGSALFEQFSGNIYANGGGGERGGDALVTLSSAGGMTVNNVYADGGSGMTIPVRMARGGDAGITLLNSSASSPLLVSGTVRARGGTVSTSDGLADGGNASVIINSAGGIDISGYVEAYGRDSANGGAGGAASIQLTSTSLSTGVTIDGGEIYAEAGDGGFGSINGGNGGNAMVSVTSAAGIVVDTFVGADGGYGGSGSSGDRGNGGNATVTLMNTGSAPVTVNSDVVADAGSGTIGGDASVAITSAGGIFVSSDVLAYGGSGFAGSVPGKGGNASIVMTNTSASSSIELDYFSSVRAMGGGLSRGAGGSGNGGDAVIILSSAGGISLYQAQIEATGGDVGGSGGASDRGGAAGVTMLASGNILIEGGEGAAWGGGGPVGGDAAVNVVAGGNIQIEGGEAFINLLAYSSGGVPGNASAVASSGGNLMIASAAEIYTSGLAGLGGANITVDDSNIWGGTGTQIDASGSLTVTNSGSVVGGGNANITTGGNVLVENNGLIAGYPDVMMKVGGEVFINTGGQIHAGMPSTIYLTFPMLTSGGFTVNGIPGLVFDGSTGFFAGGSGAILGTNLLVTYGGGAELNVPTDTLIVAMGESIQPPDAEKDKDIFEDENQSKKKKDAPVCR